MKLTKSPEAMNAAELREAIVESQAEELSSMAHLLLAQIATETQVPQRVFQRLLLSAECKRLLREFAERQVDEVERVRHMTQAHVMRQYGDDPAVH